MGVGVRFLVRLRRGIAMALAVMALGAIAPVAAEATTSCAYDSGTDVLSVDLNAPNDSAILRLIAVETIDVRESGGLVTCSGGTPTAANTDLVSVTDKTANGDTSLSVLEAPNLAPGVPINYASGGGFDTLLVFAVPATPALLRVGNDGVNTDGDNDADITFLLSATIPESFVLLGSNAADTISAQGGAGTGSAMSGTSLELRGEAGNDTLEGGEIGDLLNGDLGDDTLRGFGGEDALVGDAVVGAPGDDLYDGGAGGATARFGTAQNGVTVDLAKTGPQPTGEGNDTFISVENVDGSKFADTLLGGVGANHLTGQGGDDLIDGRDGDDSLNGGSGIDTVTYAEAPAGVAADLTAGKASGGYGSDSLLEFENLIGSRFADALVGNKEANAITALGGSDTVQALAGPDRVEVRDGVADNASCGSEVDTAISDRLSLDTVQSDCELVDALPEPAQPGGAGGGGNAGGSTGGNGPKGQSTKDTSVKFSLRAAKRQPLLAQGGVIVNLRCPQEACTVTVRGGRRLKPITVHLAARATKAAKLKIRKAKRAAIRRLLLAGGTPKLRLSATASDAAGNSASAKLTVTAKPLSLRHG